MHLKNQPHRPSPTPSQSSECLPHPENTIPAGAWIWVFASDNKGKHNKGYAKTAHIRYRAQYGCAQGQSGNAYAILTHKSSGEAVDADDFVEEFLRFKLHAEQNPHLKFYLTTLAPFPTEVVAPLAIGLPGNVSIPALYSEYLAGQVASFGASVNKISLELN